MFKYVSLSKSTLNVFGYLNKQFRAESMKLRNNSKKFTPRKSGVKSISTSKARSVATSSQTSPNTGLSSHSLSYSSFPDHNYPRPSSFVAQDWTSNDG
ncbi:hypothetical protein TNCV_3789561 [Trichonephila clavipes]|nr:hypothetical protein TNCV_3789561 [Trichonephila clavipes]